MYGAQPSMPPPKNGPIKTSPSFSTAPTIRPARMTPGTEVKPPMISTGKALSATHTSAN